MSHDEHDELLTAAAIARLANVGRAAVSNWRRRYPEFPKPDGGSPTSPTFSKRKVEAWLAETGKADQLATAGRTDTGTHQVDPDASLDAMWRNAIQLQPERSITDLTPRQLLAKIIVSLLPRSTATANPVTVDDAPVVLDPACCGGMLLMAAADRFGDRVKLVGQDIQEVATSVTAFNLRTNFDGTPYDLHTGDSLLDNQLDRYRGTAAAVVCELPTDQSSWSADKLINDSRWEFGLPAPRDAELAWVQHCFAHLRPRGVAVVAVSPRTCMQPSGQRIRAALVRSGVLRDVIALPKGLGRDPAAERCLWVLRRQYGKPDYADVRMVDLSWLADPLDVPHEFAAWQRLFADTDPPVCRPVPRVELLDGDTNLLPSRYVATRVEASAKDLARVTDRLQALYARVGQGLPRFAAPRSPIRHSYVTLGELERVGALRILSRDTTPRAGDLLLRTLGRPPVVATGTNTDEVGVAQVIELDETRLDGYFVATFLRTDADALPVANTLGALSRDDLRRCRIPRMPLAEQYRYGAAFRNLHELHSALSVLATVSASVIDQTIHGLMVGAVTPGPFPMNNTDPTEGEKRQP